ncbi:Pentatricopeptide repeat-containing protein, chloroplastic [Vitis vinifera]|uniref:Pentatricopeptide repeat-containing protein, chloroplastic n=1 Tax=Vitis vinifera TaxID=29760 RepID=A0A438KPJ4_VITVI|nr:Pentatricopeptide repeat-containing protein, chloroplastic [Vitis vinifera]
MKKLIPNPKARIHKVVQGFDGWEAVERPGFKEILNGSVEYGGERLKREHLRELSEILEKRGEVRWLLDDDVEVEQGSSGNERRGWSPARRRGGDADAIRFLVDRLTAADITIRDWKFSRVMKQSGLQFTERQLLRIVEELGARGHWKHALSVVEWVYTDKG